MSGVAKRGVTAGRADDERTSELHVMARTESVPRILCIDDEPAMLVLLTRALGSRFEVVALEDPLAALALLERAGGFSVVISDMRMPQMDGAELLARVKQIAPSVTRLALTACLERQLTSDEVFGILTKPCPVRLLHESVMAAVQRHALLQRAEAVTRPPPLETQGLGPTELPCRVIGSETRPRRSSPGSHARRLAMAAGHEVAVTSDTRLYLQLLGTSTELGPRATLLGSSPDCDIFVNDPRIEPRHVRFFNSWRGVTLQDLSRANDVRLNGQTLAGVRHIRGGDWLSVGPFRAEVRSRHDVDASVRRVASPPTRSDAALRHDGPPDARERPLARLGAVADKLLLLGQRAEAERVLRPHLEELERQCRRGPHARRSECDTAVALAARLAAELRAPAWIDYVFRVFTALGRPLDAIGVDLLRGVLRQVPGASLSGFHGYLRALAAAQAGFSAAEQLSMRRLEELEHLMR